MTLNSRVSHKLRKSRLNLTCSSDSFKLVNMAFLFLFIGTVLFSSKSGSGGGAIELIAINGTLTIGKKQN